MRFNTRILSLSLALGILAWILDAAIHARFFRDGGFLDEVLLDVPPEELVHRVMILVLLVTFGFIVSLLLFRQETIEEEAAKRAMEESEASFRDLAELLPESLFEADLTFRVTYANRRAFELFGYSQDDFEAGLSGLDMIAPEHHEEAEASLRRRMEGVEPGVVEYTGVRRDGSTFPMLFHASLVRIEGRPVGIRGIIVDITDRKEAEEVLRDSERRFRNIVEASPMGIFLYKLEADGRLVFTAANASADTILGVDNADFVGKTIEEAFPPLAETEVPDRYRDAAADGTPWHTEQINYDHAGISGAFEVSAFQTAPSEVAVMFLDITERKNAEGALRTSEERLRLAARSGRIGVWEYDIGQDHLEWDDLMFDLYGVGPAVATDGIQRWRNCVHPEDLEAAEGEFQEALRVGGRPFDTQFRIIRGDDGSVRFIRGLAGVFRDAAGVPVRVVGTNWDITESKQIEEALRGSEQRFRSVIEQLNDATYILFNGRFDLVNPRFCELTGITAEEAAGAEFDFWDLVAPGSIPVIKKRQEQRERGEEVPGLYEFEILHRDGHPVQVEASVTEIDYLGGRAILGLLRDVTEQKSLKEQLLLAQKMESIGRLSGGVAHDLNNLLTPIIGYGDLIHFGMADDDERRESVHEILQAAYRARDLVRQLLAFSRRQAMEFQAIDLNDLVKGFQSLLRRTIQADIKIRLLPSPTEPVIRGDRGQLEQVIMNLAVNAQDAMPGGGTLTIETSEVELDAEYAWAHSGVSPGHYAMLCFTDSGMGMDPETRDKVFEPFFTTKERGKGTGLGLATVYGIVKQHEGNIWVYSEPGAGTIFKCYFPLVDGPAADEVALRVDVGDLHGTETIMVVEDEVMVRKLAVKVLKNQGYSVLESSGGKACLDALRAHDGPLDLLLTDMVMPGMNGRELSGEVQNLFPGSKVLFMSGYTEDMVTSQGVLDQGIPFVQKPFSGKGLAMKVRAVLGRKERE